MKHKKYDFRTAYIDLLINVLTGMVFLFMITTLLIQTQKQQEEGVKKDAQYIISVEWPTELDCDVDLWVRDPQRVVVSYQNKDAGLMHIERDDRGWQNDSIFTMFLDKMRKDNPERLKNEETWVLRGKQPGEYNVNLHLYSCRLGEAYLKLGDKIQVPVKLKIIKLNPTVSEVFTREIILEKVWQEKSAVNFTLRNDNSFDPEVNYDFHDLVREQP
jgi:hypothetical protein